MVGFGEAKERQLSLQGYGTAGLLSGTLTRLLSQPLDVLKIRFQLQHEPLQPNSHNYYWSMRQASLRILREEHFRALWKGHISAQILSMTYGFAQFQSFEYCTKFVHVNVTIHGKPITDLICGSFSGCIGTIVSMPFDTLRTRLVGQGEPKIYRGLIHAITTMIRQEGIVSFYKGLIPCLIQIMPQTAIQFASFRLLSQTYWMVQTGEKSDKLPLTGNLICGSLAGLIAKVSVYPFDLSKKRLQVQGFEEARLHFGRVTKYSGLFDCLKKSVAEEGIRGLYKGLGPSILKAMITTALSFTFYEEISHIFINLGLFPKKIGSDREPLKNINRACPVLEKL